MSNKTKMPIHHLVESHGDSIPAKIVSAILWDVTDRRGWRQEWDEFDRDIQKEIVQVWLGIVEEIMGEDAE